jgi:hypothetical protein
MSAMRSLTIRRRALRDLLLLGSCFVALAHCQLETEGLGLDGGQAGTSSDGFGGASGGPFTQGTGGTSNEGGTAGAGGLGGAAGVGGSDNPSGASGAAGNGGEGGSTAGSASGAAGEGGGGAAGSGGAGCDAAKGEFSVPSAPGSCFFFLGNGSLVTPPSERTQWDWDEARIDCEALQARLASLAELAEYDAVQDLVSASNNGGGGGTGGGSDVGGVRVTSSVWIGARTDADPGNQSQLAQSFVWQSGEEWKYDPPEEHPWGADQPDFNFFGVLTERCVEMREPFDFNMNNLGCDTNLNFVLCERAVL